MKKFLLTLTLGLFCLSCQKEESLTISNQQVNAQTTVAARIATDNSLMGNPSNASTLSTTNYLMQKMTYTLSYNSAQGKPNWVSWHLDKTWLGTATRCDCFSSDALLPSGVYRVSSSSYTGSGFDRGHHCPSGDRTYSSTDNRETFLMTNMMPQAPTNNQQTWENLESYCRTLVSKGNECYIICGSYGQGGTGSNGGTTLTIDAGRVTVPKQIWKVILVLPSGTNDISRVTTSTRVIAVNTPNINSINPSWGLYRTSVDAIETATGYDILSALPDAIEATLESQVDNGPTQ